MARKIIWTARAQKERIEIYSFWNKHNKSPVYSRKLHELIKVSLRLISLYPLIGKCTEKQNVRVKVLLEYLIIYEITENEIVVLSFWDCRQKPEDNSRK